MDTVKDAFLATFPAKISADIYALYSKGIINSATRKKLLNAYAGVHLHMLQLPSLEAVKEFASQGNHIKLLHELLDKEE